MTPLGLIASAALLTTSSTTPPQPVLDPLEPAWPAPKFDAGAPIERRSYLRLGAGLVTTEDSNGPDEDVGFDEGYMLSLALGRRLGASENGLGVSLELEGYWSDQDADDQGPLQAVSDVTAGALFLDGILDLRLADAVSLYGGGGIGAAWVDVGTRSDSIHDFTTDDGPYLAWQARAGAAFHLTANTSLYAGYRFVNIDDADIDDGLGSASFDLETQQHVLEVGVSFGF